MMLRRLKIRCSNSPFSCQMDKCYESVGRTRSLDQRPSLQMLPEMVHSTTGPCTF